MVALVPEEVLRSPPSREDGVDAAAEAQLRDFGAELLFRAGVLLRVPQLTIVSAALLFQRYYFRRSFADLDVRGAASGALLLACKLEERHRKLRDVVVVFHRLEMREDDATDAPSPYKGGPAPQLDAGTPEYAASQKETTRAERRVLQELGFAHVQALLDPPHRYVLQFLEELGRPSKALAQQAWQYVNDSLRSVMCCAYQPQHIATAGIFLAARDIGVKLPAAPPWWEALCPDLGAKAMRDIAGALLALNGRPPPRYIRIPTKKRPVPVIVEPMTPLPETPAPAKSPSASDSPNDGAGLDAAVAAIAAGRDSRPDAGGGLDRARVDEMLAEQPKGGGAVLAPMVPPALPAPAKVPETVSSEAVARTTSGPDIGKAKPARARKDKKLPLIGSPDRETRKGKPKNKEQDRCLERRTKDKAATKGKRRNGNKNSSSRGSSSSSSSSGRSSSSRSSTSGRVGRAAGRKIRKRSSTPSSDEPPEPTATVERAKRMKLVKEKDL